MKLVEESLKNKSSFLFDVLKRYDHYIATTNYKAGLLLSFIAAIILGLTIRLMLRKRQIKGIVISCANKDHSLTDHNSADQDALNLALTFILVWIRIYSLKRTSTICRLLRDFFKLSPID